MIRVHSRDWRADKYSWDLKKDKLQHDRIATITPRKGDQMKPIDPTEISMMIDGELDPEREKIVCQAITEDESLRREYENLISLDSALKSYGNEIMFQPNVQIPQSLPLQPVHFPLLGIPLLILHIAIKFLSPILGSILVLSLLCFVISCILRSMLRASDQECRILGATL